MTRREIKRRICEMLATYVPELAGTDFLKEDFGEDTPDRLRAEEVLNDLGEEFERRGASKRSKP